MSDGIEINTYYELYCQCKLERDLLKKELQATREQVKRMDTQHKCGECGNVVLWYDQVHYLDIINEKDQIIEKAESALNKAIKSAEFFMSHADCRKDSWSCKCSFCRDTEHSKNLREARQYFKQKDEVKNEN